MSSWTVSSHCCVLKDDRIPPLRLFSRPTGTVRIESSGIDVAFCEGSSGGDACLIVPIRST